MIVTKPVVLLALLAALLGTSRQSSAAAQSIGLAFVREHCASCHAIGKSGDGPHPAAPPFRRISDFYSLDRLAEMLEAGRLYASHPDMPTFKFDRDSTRALIEYLRSIQE